jgi:hypothetical protein
MHKQLLWLDYYSFPFSWSILSHRCTPLHSIYPHLPHRPTYPLSQISTGTYHYLKSFDPLTTPIRIRLWSHIVILFRATVSVVAHLLGMFWCIPHREFRADVDTRSIVSCRQFVPMISQRKLTLEHSHPQGHEDWVSNQRHSTHTWYNRGLTIFPLTNETLTC